MYQYRITFKSRNEPDIFMPAHTVESQKLLSEFLKTDRVVEFGGTIFRCSDVKRVSKEWVVDYKTETPKELNLTEEERLHNIRRLRWVKVYIMAHKAGKTPEARLEAALAKLPESEAEGYTKFFNWYHSPEQTERRELRDEFRRTHFDRLFVTHEDFDRAFNRWLETRNQPDLVPLAEQIFGVSAH